MEVLNTLDYDGLSTNIGRIACPFSNVYEGPLGRFYMDMRRRDREHHCAKLCGKLFPKLYQAQRCPCHITGKKRYVKKRFWEQLEKARKEAQQ